MKLLPLNTVQRNVLFGEFTYTPNNKVGAPWITQNAEWLANLELVHVPQLAQVMNAPRSCKILFHRLGASPLKALFQAWENAGLLGHVRTFDGAFAPRLVRATPGKPPLTTLSAHAWGTAFDLNAKWNGLGAQPAPSGAIGSLIELVPLANDHGFYWGGNFQSRPDGMHFELAEVKQ